MKVMAAGKRLRVLFVEDSSTDVELCQRALQNAGYELAADVVDSAEGFARRLDAGDYDVILSDFNLPAWTGLDALKTLRQQRRDIPFILVTGSLGEETAVEAIQHGAADFILKDRLARLPVAVQRALEEKALRVEREQAEEARREAGEKLRAIFDASPVALIMMDTQGRILSWNRGAERIFGWTEDEVLGKRLPIVPEEKEQEFNGLLARALSGDALAGVEVRRRRKDGSPVDIAVSTAMVCAADGGVTGLAAAISDITEQKQLQEQLRQAQKMEAIGRLSGGIAHDFNNLLGVIKGYTEIACGGLPAEDPLRRPLGEVQRAADRAAALTRQLLAFSRQQVLEPQVLNLGDTVEVLRGMFERLLPESIELTTALEPDLGSVKVDPGQLEQVIMNLVLNARDAMPDGGPLTLEARNVELDETYSRKHLAAPPGPYVLLMVSDSGIGMDAETLAHVFEPFFTTKEQGKGTGLGLATVYGIVKQSGGYVWAYSESGRGSTFKIYLPRVEEKPREQSVSRAADIVPRGSETVLVVEDEEGLRALAREFLETCGYTVLDARDGIEALEIVRRNSATIHLLLTDVILPRLSGRELAVQLAILRPLVKVLYMSGYTDRAVLQNGVLEPGLAFLQKPFSLRTLAAKIREVLDA
ncbi:MAG: response regulator [Candidatus Acidiferrales bacterium]